MQTLFESEYQERMLQPVEITSATMNQLSHELLAVEQENTLLRLILASSSDPILITDRHTNIIYVNPSWEKLTGYTFAEVKDKNPRILQSGKTPQKVYNELWEALNNNQSYTTEETIDKRKDGSEYQIHSTFFSVQKDGIVFNYVQIQHDITQRKQLEDMRKGFLNIAAHELKTPITVLKLISQVHIQKAKKGKKTVINLDELEFLDQELDRLTRLIDDILDSSRFETGKMFLQVELINMTKLIHETISEIKKYSRNHAFLVSEMPKELIVNADQNRIRQVLLNLLSNAAKYSSPKTKITVAAKKITKYVVVSVEDEGSGIAKEKQKYIFDKYYQVKEKEAKGFGLGLYISKDIIKRHKGKIWVESEIGKGSIFSFSLPYKETASRS